MFFLIVACFLPAIILLWLFLCMPAAGKKRARRYEGVKFAHRGLHSDDCAEDSIAAFERACEAGYGIELDVQFTKDGEIVVFHDDSALRMTGKDELVGNMDLSELKKLDLITDGSKIPSFKETLAAVNGRVPLLVEIKTCRDIKRLTRAVVDMLRDYEGDYIVESFNPFCIAELRKYAPEMIRGQLVTGRRDYKGQSAIAAFLLSELLLNVVARPDFVAYNHKVSDTAGLWLNRKVFRIPLAAWTIVDADEAVRLSENGVMPIFERSLP